MAATKTSRIPEDEEFVKKLREIRNGKPVSRKETKKLAAKSTVTNEEIETLAMLTQKKKG